ncbi:heparinase II/III family protein [Pedobacter rhodius]|uniref:Heparinase II/III family protein n=1 Tax=Pedobacter rhodius TaxID=3004098 RepID=A0ABT4KZ57_9SPHI|nr:heparinase II/III family protein [Pedobacter sp. SJ11]MCZ4223487.1 heparinase II/III family protein [Pedobacter sp. SJ11]
MLDNKILIKIVLTAFLSIFSSFAFAQNTLYEQTEAWKKLAIENWKGAEQKGNELSLTAPGTVSYEVPDGGKKWFTRGLMEEYDGVIDGRQWYGIQMDLYLESDAVFETIATISIPKQAGRHNLPDSSKATIHVQGKGWHAINIPFSSFDYNRGQFYFLKFLKTISFSGAYLNLKGAKFLLKNIKLVKGNPLKLSSLIRSKAGLPGNTIKYEVNICNSSEVTQQVNLAFRRTGWEGMPATVNPSVVALKAGETKKLEVSVLVPGTFPEGAQETQVLEAVSATTSTTEKIEFITLRKLEGPFLIHQEQGWKNVLEKTKKYDWAKKSMIDYIRKADEFEVPEVPSGGIPAENSKAVYKSYLEQRFWPVGVAYKLTGEKKYAEKLALVLTRLAAPDAYPQTLHANNQGIPQEGGFFEACARSYDLIKDAGVLSDLQKALVEQTFRLYIYTVEDGLGNGGISNWSVFNLCPAAQCALVLQDMAHFNYLMDGPCGIRDHLKYGMMDDGWWYEMSLSYNLGCAENMTALGLAARPFGIDFLNEKIPVPLTKKVGLRPFEFENFQGMAFGKFGPVKENFITVKRMWDAITIYPDYRSVMFGMGDGHEHEVGGVDFEKAYFAFRDSSYAAIIKQGKSRDLIYGVPELPLNTPKLYTKSGHSDNAGLAVLRSQTDNRAPREQIQAALKYGTHGSYHGHFDRLSLVSLMRYGRSFWNPETSWFGYGSYMYKWWVQPSMAHNMVVVDGKQQEPVESKPLLFHSGKMMQAIAAETFVRWSNPPYFGGYAQVEQVKKADAPYVPIPGNHPNPTDVTDYTEPVLQRRLLLVTDDYVITADYLKAKQAHTFDNLLHLRGAKPDASLQLIGRDEKFDTNPLSSGQFITNVTNYSFNGIAKVHSKLIADPTVGWESGGFNGFQEPGELNTDTYQVWPQKALVRIGNYAEAYSINKKLVYEVLGDEQILAKDSMGTWLLGRADLDVPVKNIKTLTLKTTKTGNAKNSTLFWAGAKIITSKGKVIPLDQLKISTEQLIPVETKNTDYKGGPVRIAGVTYTESIPAEPQNDKKPGLIKVDLSGLDAARLLVSVGGDAPVGNEDQVRKTVSFRTRGKETSYLTLIEPYEAKQNVKKITSNQENLIDVELIDGRIQHLKIDGLKSKDGKLTVEITEEKNGKILRTERTETH